MSRVPDLEYSALEMLELGEERATANGIAFWLVDLNPSVMEVVRRAGLDKQLGPDRLLFNARMAIARYNELQERAASTAETSSAGNAEAAAPPPP